jgi:hypothetical protein
VKAVIFAHLPPDDPGAFALELQPGGDVGFVIQISDNNLVPSLERAADGETEQAKERRGIHSEGYLSGVARVDENSHTPSSALNDCVDLHAPRVAPAALHIAVQKVTIHCIENNLGDLGTSGIIEEDEVRFLMKRRKLRTNFIAREVNSIGPE